MIIGSPFCLLSPLCLVKVDDQINLPQELSCIPSHGTLQFHNEQSYSQFVQYRSNGEISRQRQPHDCHFVNAKDDTTLDCACRGQWTVDAACTIFFSDQCWRRVCSLLCSTLTIPEVEVYHWLSSGTHRRKISCIQLNCSLLLEQSRFYLSLD